MDEHAQQPTRSPFALAIDLRDLMGFGGTALVLGAAATWSWTTAAGVLGLGLLAVALRLAK